MVSGGTVDGVVYDPIKKGKFKNVKKQISGRDSTNELLSLENHGGPENLFLRVYDDYLIHQGKNTANQNGSYSEGCISITAYSLNLDNDKGITDVDRNYEKFKNIIMQGSFVNVEIK